MESLRLEEKLTPENIEKAIRYMTQCIETQWGQAMVNLTTKNYRGKPLSQSVLLHEIIEAEEFEKMGYKFSSLKLETMSNEERWEQRELKNKSYMENQEPHLLALKGQYIFLSSIAEKQGLEISPGTLLKLSPISPIPEVESALEKYDGLGFDEEEIQKAKEFMLRLLGDEPDYGRIFSEVSSKGSGIYLYKEFPDEVRGVLG